MVLTYNWGGKNRRYYLHYIGEIGEKNDVHYVIWCFQHFFASNFCRSFKKITIWSDGGPKHFKVSSFMGFILELQRKLNIPFEYNFFVSYHGRNSCDAMAAVARKQLNNYRTNHKEEINSADKVCEIIRNVGSTYAFQVPSLKKLREIKENDVGTFIKIRSFYKWTFDCDSNSILAENFDTYKDYHLKENDKVKVVLDVNNTPTTQKIDELRLLEE